MKVDKSAAWSPSPTGSVPLSWSPSAWQPLWSPPRDASFCCPAMCVQQAEELLPPCCSSETGARHTGSRHSVVADRMPWLLLPLPGAGFLPPSQRQVAKRVTRYRHFVILPWKLSQALASPSLLFKFSNSIIWKRSRPASLSSLSTDRLPDHVLGARLSSTATPSSRRRLPCDCAVEPTCPRSHAWFRRGRLTRRMGNTLHHLAQRISHVIASHQSASTFPSPFLYNYFRR